MAMLDGRMQLQRTRRAIYHAEIQLRQYSRLLSDNEHFQNRFEAVSYFEGCVFFIGLAYRSLLRELAAFYRLGDVVSLDELEQQLALTGKRAPEIQILRDVQTGEGGSGRISGEDSDNGWWVSFNERYEQLFRAAFQVPKQQGGAVVVQEAVMFRSSDIAPDESAQLRAWLSGMQRLIEQVRASVQEW